MDMKMKYEIAKGWISEGISNIPPRFTYEDFSDAITMVINDFHTKVKYEEPKQIDEEEFFEIDCDELEFPNLINEEDFLQYSADMLCEINAYERSNTYEKDTITCIKLRTHKNKSYIRFRCNNTMYNLDVDGVYENGKATGKVNKDTDFYVSANLSGGQILEKNKRFDNILSSFQNQLSYFKSVKNITHNKKICY